MGVSKGSVEGSDEDDHMMILGADEECQQMSVKQRRSDGQMSAPDIAIMRGVCLRLGIPSKDHQPSAVAVPRLRSW